VLVPLPPPPAGEARRARFGPGRRRGVRSSRRDVPQEPQVGLQVGARARRRVPRVGVGAGERGADAVRPDRAGEADEGDGERGVVGQQLGDVVRGRGDADGGHGRGDDEGGGDREGRRGRGAAVRAVGGCRDDVVDGHAGGAGVVFWTLGACGCEIDRYGEQDVARCGCCIGVYGGGPGFSAR